MGQIKYSNLYIVTEYKELVLSHADVSMPRYNALLITRPATKDVLAACLKRTISLILEEDGVVRGVKHMGMQELPHRMKAHTHHFTHGNYFLLDFHLKNSALPQFKKELKFEEDIIRPTIMRAESDFDEKVKKLPLIY